MSVSMIAGSWLSFTVECGVVASDDSIAAKALSKSATSAAKSVALSVLLTCARQKARDT